jgi:DNA-directed RNA polymerase III subunit RPC3
VQYRLVKFAPIESNESIAEYTLLNDKVLLFLRYPRYMYYIQKKKGNPGALLLEELLRSGMSFAHCAIFQAYTNTDVKNDQTLIELRDTFLDMINEKFFIRCSQASEDAVPKLTEGLQGKFQASNIDLKELKAIIEGKDPASVVTDKVYWTVNFDKLHLCFRDKVLIDCIERQIDSNAAECFQFMITLMYKYTESWEAVSNPISIGEIKQIVERKSTNAELVRHIEQYVSIIEKDECGFVRKDNDLGGATYNIDMKKAFTQMTWSIIDNVVNQKFGTKAARIFRVVRAKKYIEQEEIQREAMIPPKEARLFTYKLLEENLVQIKSIKKSGGTGPSKPMYLFYVNQHQIARDLIETCYKTLYNFIVRVNQDKEMSRRLMDKELRLQLVIDSLKERGDPEEAIQEISDTLTPPERESIANSKMRLKRLESSEIMVDEMLFLLQLYLHYHSCR